MGDTSIEWTDATWNPVRGCSRVSPGCDNCYAMRFAHRFSGTKIEGNGVAVQRMTRGRYHGLTTIRKGKVDWTGTARFVSEQLALPLKWRKPRRIFVNSMSDLFHHDVTNEQIAAVFGVMAACPQHTFQVLTKRPERMVEWFKWVTEVATDEGSGRFVHQAEACRREAIDRTPDNKSAGGAWSPAVRPLLGHDTRWPLPNVWLGVSCENQETADKRIPLLLQVPAAIRFVSAEPLLGPIDFGREYFTAKLGKYPFPNLEDKHRTKLIDLVDWVIVGGESGPGARAFIVDDAAAIVGQCRGAGVPVFFKQMGSHVLVHDYAGWPDDTRTERGTQDGHVLVVMRDRKGGDPSEWPHDLRVREFPTVERCT